ncbi:FAD-dependent oxidoreductase [Streptomyces sp. GQFP]|uniref:FAD-dependent oxidoreductase n=1 Tax=Streptomyces sp. GQFP TaxID=2907545 RepID=UPI001F3FFE50|nr:FAD-dependent oxidoreductase [Streptomyces sp. GQFP]UIX29372.1 FAD-dependent oxidoreductase [Streptomyces sp. GQFP]
MAVAEGTTPIDPTALRDALDVANIPTLVPLLFQLTGDPKWTRDPYRPTRPRGTDDHDDAGLPADVRDEIRAAVAEAVLAWAAGRPVARPAPTGRELLDLLTLSVGEEVPEEYEPMTAEHMGFRAKCPPTVATPGSADFHVLVIGAGVSGLTAAKHLRDLGISHTVVEKNPRVGGTWIENRYPGCGVDTPSYLYSLSFFPRAWTHHFGKRGELETYLDELATHFGLLDSIRFGTTAVSAAWDDDTERWTVVVRDPQGRERTLTANALISAVGQLNVPKIPDLPGLADFHGPVFHSARWPEDLDLRGRTVAVIGTGASAMQIVPAVAGEVAALDVYQRSPQWVSPNKNYFRPVGDKVHWLMENVPYYRAWYRFRLAWAHNDRVHASLQKDPDWPHPERSLNATNDGHRRFFTRYILDQLDGRPDLVEKALPDYPPFGKRMLLDNGWFAALRRPGVELITASVTALTRTGVVTSTGEERPADIVVLATGFEAHRPIRYDIVGRGGQVLRDLWGEDDARAYLGITTPGFPNLFFMYGPNTNLGHGGSFIFLAESQIDYITDSLCRMVNEDISSIECRPEVGERYNEALDQAHQRMVWTHQGMDTWYRNSKGRVVTNMPWRVVDYWTMTRAVDLDDFVVRHRPAAAGQAPGA